MEQYRKFTFFLIAGLLVVTMGCSQFEIINETGIRDKFLVDKIYDYHNKMLAEYIYDNNNLLTNRIVTDTIVKSQQVIYRRAEDEFQYRNGRVSKIIRTSQAHDDTGDLQYTSNSEITFEYDSQKRLTMRTPGGTDEDFTPLYEDLTFRYKKGRVVGFLDKKHDPRLHTDTMVYNQSGNITEHVYIRANRFGSGTTERIVHQYEYDNQLKPNFGLDYLFVYQPIPYMGTVVFGLENLFFYQPLPYRGNIVDYEMLLSKNNMTKAISEGHTYVYTYNENGLPATIETIWNGIETSSPMLMRISYKQIK